ncbi:hypothetical protein ASE01_22325 [Nocardioides sp. Root190]|uniref:DUF2231 domain-containing protein n=1 Tax=Nocardioides sp. Root190 TaxID=1736488 RepID=UPI0006FD59EC|nr:DUF2231 domain-containing protein [Nocardioides sp. Root190]KRB72782.1 hypothetical protein ASE01_22325 [Nocardioides sp. Root190]
MEINGVPLHPLVVHSAVVFTPLAVLAALAYAVPSWRDRLRWPLVVLAAISLVSIWVAHFSGDDLREERFEAATGTFAERLDDHERYADQLRIAVTVFALLAFVSAWLHTRTGTVRTALAAVTVVAALATAVLVFLTGDAGAQATWKIDG